MFNEIILFTDGSVNPQTKVGYGASLVISEPDLSLDAAKSLVKVKRFENTSSTRLELQTLLWALTELQTSTHKLIVVTDSQNIIGLPGRRKRLEKNNYRSRNGKKIVNCLLYQEFYLLTDQLNCEFRKVSGHLASHRKENVDKLFALVDRASRDALRVSEE